jgi:hypothetical protein
VVYKAEDTRLDRNVALKRKKRAALTAVGERRKGPLARPY